MSKSSASSVIRLRGVRQNNLKNFDLDLPLHRLIVITGLSGSGKSSLAFDTLYAEGQRRYIETFSPYARQFFDRMDKPQVDSIEGIPPAIAIEQRNAIRTTRSTVGTITEICDYMKVLWPRIAQLHCRGCGKPVRKDSPQQIWETLGSVGRASQRAADSGKIGSPEASPCNEVLVTFDLPLSEKLSLADSLALISKQGYQQLMVNGEIVRLEEAESRIAHLASRTRFLTVVQDRIKFSPAMRPRFVEACEQAYHFGKGKLAIHIMDDRQLFSNRLHCAQCDIEYRDPSPALFSFNHPLGACPTCKGFGRIISIDYDLAIPDRSLTLANGAVKPWRSGFSAECQDDLLKFCKAHGVSADVPFDKLQAEHQCWIIEGDEDYGIDEAHEWPHAWYGIKGYFRWLESKAYKMHVRVLLSRYRAYKTCPDCCGARLKPDALLYLLPVGADVRRLCSTIQNALPPHLGPDNVLTLADFYALPIRYALAVIEHFSEKLNEKKQSTIATRQSPIQIVLHEVRSRLRYLNEVGLGYLTLDRPTRTLSGGETERVKLTTCLGTRLVNTLYILDEPSVGLHPRDTERLVRILQQLRDAGNTVIVVEHEASIIRAADRIVDLGPGHGESGGHVVFQGSCRKILKCTHSPTGQYLSGRKRIDVPEWRPVANSRLETRDAEPETGQGKTALRDSGFVPPGRISDLKWLFVQHATRHNLRDLTAGVPLNRFVCITGVSGSGKSTLIDEVLYPTLAERLQSQNSNSESKMPKASERMDEEDVSEEGISHPARHASRITGFESLGQVVLVDQSILGKTPRSNPAVYTGAFDDLRELFAQSDTAKQWGFNASTFSFNSVQGQCEHCRGAGFEKIEMQFLSDVFIRCPDCNGRRYRQHVLEVKIRNEWSIADVLDATVDEVVEFLLTFGNSKPAQRACETLKLLQEVGLGYLRLGQPINTLSGGESQRLKLVRHLAEAQVEGHGGASASVSRLSTLGPRSTLFLFDEPTTGLHFDDIRTLLQVFQRLVDVGHSLIVIEHNLDVIKCADWVIDLGPGAGDEGGQIVAQGTPKNIADCRRSQTGQALRAILRRRR